MLNGKYIELVTSQFTKKYLAIFRADFRRLPLPAQRAAQGEEP
jgi:hypothetical protein